MTEKTTRIYVELTDFQMDNIQDLFAKEGGYWFHQRLCIAIDEQRPRQIAVGDRVTIDGHLGTFDVEGIKDQWAWLWRAGNPWLATAVKALTRVDDEATP